MLTFVVTMKEKQIMTQRQALTQTLAPLQVRYVKLLEMNSAAIEDEVKRQLDENPALEGAPENRVEDTGSMDFSDYDSEDDRADVYAAYRRQGRGNAAGMPIEASADNGETLRESLERQLGELELPLSTRRLAIYIIGNLDDNGRLTRSLQSMADDITIHTGVDVSDADMQHAMETVRGLDPAGVGAYDLKDCLLLQLDRRKPAEARNDAKMLVDKHFDLLAVNNFDRLRIKSGLTPQRLELAVEYIKTLNPKPANAQSMSFDDRVMQITPDFSVEPDENHRGRFVITLLQNIPELTVSESYNIDNENLQHGERGNSARLFIRSRRQEATEFIDLIERRNATLMAVMKAIVKIQSQFFVTEDAADIKPMILKDISELIGKDLSVISRATSGKYVATPGGVYPLKMFFNERPNDDLELSQHSILTEMKKIIDDEDKHKPLSDDALTDMLAQRGMPIARRTVAKYREQLNIPNSRGRRAMKTKK